MSGFKHGHWGTPTWRSWDSMVARCTRPSMPAYPRYGGAGISVCERWKAFGNFLLDMGGRPTGTTLERINNAIGYQPSNCRWASPKEQARNRKSNVLLTHSGKTQPLAAWADEKGIGRNTLEKRIKAGWPTERALNPADGRK